MVKTFIFDARGFKIGLGGTVDKEVNAWMIAEAPASVDNMDITISDSTLVVIVSFTAA